MLTHKLKVG